MESYALECGPPLEEDTPLHLAAGFGGIGIIKLLLDFGSDNNLKNAAGKTPRDHTAGRGRPREALDLLS